MTKSKLAGNITKVFLLLTTILTIFPACKRAYLDPDPLSLYEPGKTFSTRSGLDAAMPFVTAI